MRTEEYTGEICGTCIIINANGVEDPTTEEEARAYREGVDEFPGSIAISHEDEPHFSSRGCLICGTTLAGNRFHATVTAFIN